MEKLRNESLCPRNASDPNGYSIIPVHVWTHTVADVAEVVRQLGEGFTVTTPEEYLRLVKHNLGPR